MDNALLYSDGPVTLAASTGPAGELVLHVRDRGPGVPAEEREAIFERFVRGGAVLSIRESAEASFLVRAYY